MLEQALQWGFMGIIALGLFGLWRSRNVVHMVLLLLVILVAQAALFMTQGQDFMAGSQIMIYVGGVLVLVLFAIMLTRHPNGHGIETGVHQRFVGAALALSLMLGLSLVIWQSDLTGPTIQASPKHAVTYIGSVLISQHLLSFELIGLLLTIALMGAMLLNPPKPPAA